MQTIIYYIIPLVILITLVFVFFKFKKTNFLSTGSQSVSTMNATSADNQMATLAEKLGLNHEDASIQTSEKMLLNSGNRLWGIYQGVKVEIIMGGYAKEAAKTPITASYSYEYKITKEINFEVDNPNNLHFEIIQKNKHLVTQATGKASFDTHLSCSGNVDLPHEFLEFCGKIGWMNLKLNDNVLTFTDSFFEDTMASKGTMSAVEAINPIWKTSARNFNIDYENVIEFTNQIILLIEQLQLKKIN